MPVQFRDYYETLGVPKTANADEIRSAFRKLARKYHPDVAKDKKAAEEKFKEINEAYEVLSDSEKRKKYDQLGANWKNGAEFTPPPNWQGFDINEMFGRARQSQREQPGRATQVRRRLRHVERLLGRRVHAGHADRRGLRAALERAELDVRPSPGRTRTGAVE